MEMSGTSRSKSPPQSQASVALRINGQVHSLHLDHRVTLLDALREYAGFPGTKKGCDQGQCGACTVHVNGQRVLACLSLAIAHQKDEITTIEGVAHGNDLHPMQDAFIACDAFQCGYCTPGQILSAISVLDELNRLVPSHVTSDVGQSPDVLDDDEIRERMSGNICRCGAYPNIVAAIRHVQATQAQRERL